LLHGHVHNAFLLSGRGINVGVDVHGFAPVGAQALAQVIDSIEDEGRPDTA
jgi:calcineurin-like phosphoesterase family protein